MGCRPVHTRQRLDRLYERYNRPEFIHPDPLEFLFAYPDSRDREIAAFVAASLAYGRVQQILTSASKVLVAMVPGPYAYLRETTTRSISRTFSGFRHRFTDGRKLSALLSALKGLLAEHGSLQACFCAEMNGDEETILNPLSGFYTELMRCAPAPLDHLVPSPLKGSACKRLNLFLRWMVRRDDVDPGGWAGISPAKLLIPLDVHMFRVAKTLGMTERRQADMKTVLEVTAGFRRIAPSDPVRYDFCLTRLGIRGLSEVLSPLR